jgi:hypothetical protein
MGASESEGSALVKAQPAGLVGSVIQRQCLTQRIQDNPYRKHRKKSGEKTLGQGVDKERRAYEKWAISRIERMSIDMESLVLNTGQEETSGDARARVSEV